MSPRLLLFSVAFLFFFFASLFSPIYGILGYMAHYVIGAEKQWWHAPFSSLGIRYSFAFAAVIAIGIYLNRSKLKFKKLLLRQEILALLLLGLMWILYVVGGETLGRYTITDHPSIKITKVMLFCLMMTHVVTRPKDLNKVFWLLVITTLLLGLQAYELPRSAFTSGRLDGRVGGSDFLDANALAGFLVAATVISSTVFMRESWFGKFVSSASIIFALNTIVLCRSRGAVLALCGAGIVIALSAPKRLRLKIAAGVILALMALFYLSDAQFLSRVGDIFVQADSAMSGGAGADRSAEMRIHAWRGGVRMFLDHPFGVGPGNFNQNIGRYSPDISGLSPHSTYIQALADLGFIGFILVISLIINGLLMVRKVVQRSEQLPEPDRSVLQWSSSGIAAALAGYAVFGITAHLVYMEAFWWFLMLPVCLYRSCENAFEEHGLVFETLKK